jgi:type II secretory pathway pseudopilin PulG
MQNRRPIRCKKPSEEGYMLLAVICMLALLTISLSVAVPDVTKSIQHDRDVETMHRGKQYIRAIQLYYRKFGSYPPSVDALVNTNNIRFLRKKYVDPITRKDDWKPIYFGQNKAPLAMGFFGQPLGGAGMNGGAPIAGVGPSGTGGMPGQTGTGFGSGFGGPTGGGSSSISAGSIFGNSSPTGGSGSIFGSDNGSSVPTGSTGSPTDSSGNTGSGNSASGSPTDTSANGGSTGSTGTGTGSGFMSGQNGQTFGGGGIIGVEPASPKEAILVYKKKTHYNEWEFTYSPLSDMMQQAGGNTGMIGQPVGNGVGGSGTGSTGSTFGGSGGSGFGSSSGSFGSSGSSFGSSPTQPTSSSPNQ